MVTFKAHLRHPPLVLLPESGLIVVVDIRIFMYRERKSIPNRYCLGSETET